MNSKLMTLNVVLVGLLALLVFQFRQVGAAARDREARTFGHALRPEKYPPLAALPPVLPVAGASYLEVAQKMLMARDRNPNVIIDPEPVKQKPPMPPLPVVEGLMTLGEPSIIMTEKPGALQKTYRKGEKVGPFTLVAFDADKIVLDWDGEKVTRRIDELFEKTPPPVAAAASAPPPAPASAPAPSVVNTANSVPPTGAPLGPGQELAGGARDCQANDTTPLGSVQNGLKKVELVTPFGKRCMWQPVGK